MSFIKALLNKQNLFRFTCNNRNCSFSIICQGFGLKMKHATNIREVCKPNKNVSVFCTAHATGVFAYLFLAQLA